MKIDLLYISPEEMSHFTKTWFCLFLFTIPYNCLFRRFHFEDIPSPSFYYIVQRRVMPVCTILCIEYNIILDGAKINCPMTYFFNTFRMYIFDNDGFTLEGV